MSSDRTELALPAEDKEIGNGVQTESDKTAVPVQQGEDIGREAS